MGYYIGVMSGTSLDGFDIALIKQAQHGQSQFIASHFVPMPSSLHDELLALCSSSSNELVSAALAEIHWANLAAQGVLQLLKQHNLSSQDILAIGSHGQTVRHEPDKHFTIQISNGALLAELTGITVVTDFRRRDVAAGGQGAPLVPAYHEALFYEPTKNRAILNIGGFSNLSLLSAHTQTHGFDCGPGNVLLDMWINYKQGKLYDNNGQWAATATSDNELLTLLLDDDFFKKIGPKSTGRDYFNFTWLKNKLDKLDRPLAENIVQSTLLELTVQTIVQSLQRVQPDTEDLIVCGGGALNIELLRRLQVNLPEINVKTTADYGIDPNWVEAMAFAWLAYCCLNNIPANRPAVTGAKGLRVLGAIYPA